MCCNLCTTLEFDWFGMGLKEIRIVPRVTRIFVEIN